MSYNNGPRIVTNGLVIYLDAGNHKSYPGTGTTWNDLSGNGNNGTLTNGPTFNTSNKGSIELDGADDYISFGDILNLGTSDFTLEAIAKKTSGGDYYSRIAAKATYTSPGWSFYFGQSPGSSAPSVYFAWDSNWTSIDGTAPLVFNQYYHLLTTRNGNTIALYINGALQSSKTLTYNFNSNYSYILGGNGTGAENFYGNLALWRHYTKGFSTTEVLQNYNATKGRFGL